MVASRSASSRPASPTEHDLVGGDPHLRRIARFKEYCQCFGPCCVEVATMKCICEDCDCDQHAGECPPVDALPPAVVDIPLPEPTFEHACQDCGVEVFRNGTRGRYPSRCPSCKEKR